MAARIRTQNLPSATEALEWLAQTEESLLSTGTWKDRASLWKRMETWARQNAIDQEAGQTQAVLWICALRVGEKPLAITTLMSYASHLKNTLLSKNQDVNELERFYQLLKIEKKKDPHDPNRATPAKRSEIMRLLQALRVSSDGELSAVVALCWRLAGRVGDVLALTREDVSFRGEVTIIDWRRAKLMRLYRQDRYSKLPNWKANYLSAGAWLRQRVAAIPPNAPIFTVTRDQVYNRLRRHNNEWSCHSLRRGALGYALTLLHNTAGATSIDLAVLSRFARHQGPKGGVSEVTLMYLDGHPLVPDILTSSPGLAYLIERL